MLISGEHEKVILVLSFTLLILAVLSSTASASSICYSCGECNAAIATGEEIILGGDLSASGNCLVIENKYNVTVNCKNHVITGSRAPSSSGINITGGEDHIIQNCVVEQFYYGIHVDSSLDVRLINNIATKNVQMGIKLFSADGAFLWRNNVSQSVYGIDSDKSYDIELRNNTACNNANIDIHTTNTMGTGTENKCESTINWDDAGFSGCTYSCMDCVVPYNDMKITRDTKLCRGVYHLDDLGLQGVIIINNTDITLDCDNAILKGNLVGTGVYNNGSDNVTIKNCTLRNYNYGIRISNADTNNLINNTASENADSGIVFENSNANHLEKNKALSNGNPRGNGIFFSNSLSNTLYGNRACYNLLRDINVTQGSATGTENRCDKTNAYNDFGYSACQYICPVYCYNCSDCETKLNSEAYVVPANDLYSNGSCIEVRNADGVRFDCENHTIHGVSQEFGYGIRLVNSKHMTIENCNITGFNDGIASTSSDNNKFYNNTFMYNGAGMWLSDSHDNEMTNNLYLRNLYGISLSSSDSNVIRRNRLCKNDEMDIMKRDNVGLNTAENNVCNKIYNWNNDGNLTWCETTCTGNATANCTNTTACRDALNGDFGFVNLLTDVAGGLDIGSSHVTLNCNGHNILGNHSGIGISVISEINNKILNCNIYDFSDGILLRESSLCEVRGNSAQFNSNSGTTLVSYSILPVRDNMIKDNNLTDNKIGLKLYDAYLNTIKNNLLVRNDDYSLYLEKQCTNTISENTGTLYLPVKFIHDTTVYTSGRYAEIIYCNASGTIENVIISNNAIRKEDGIFVINSNNVRLNKLDIENTNGIRIINSDFVAITNSTIWGSALEGIYLTASNDAEIANNDIRGNAEEGIETYVSNRAKLINNTVRSNGYGIRLEGSNNTEIIKNQMMDNLDDGLGLFSSNLNSIRNNYLKNNTISGIYLDQESDRNQLHDNQACWHSSDIYNRGNFNSGDNNRCNKAFLWNDAGTTMGCSLQCIGWYPYNYGLGYHNPTRDDLTYGWPSEDYHGHYVDVFGIDQTYVTAWFCFGIPFCLPGLGCWCAGYEAELPTIPEPLAVIYYYAAFKDIAEPGHCAGMSTKSLDFYYELDRPDRYGLYPSPKYLEHYGTWQREVENTHGTQLTAEVINYLFYHALDEPDEIFEAAKADLLTGQRQMVIVKPSLLKGHVLVVDTIVDYPTNPDQIYVYDPNREDTVWNIYDEEYRYPAVNINGDSFDFEKDTGEIWSWDMYYFPHYLFTGDRTLPTTIDGILIVLLGSATEAVSDDSGKMLGYDEFGNPHEEIPNATAVPTMGDNVNDTAIYAMSAFGDYSADIFGNGTGNYSNFMFHKSTVYGLENVSMVPETKDHAKLMFKENNSMDGLLNFSTEDATKRFSSIIAKEFRTVNATRSYRITDSSLFGSDNVIIRTTMDFNGLVYTNRGSHSLDYGAEFGSTMLVPGREGSNEIEKLGGSGFSIGPMITHLLHPSSWYNLSGQKIIMESFVCGDKICSSEAEDYLNCPEDCPNVPCVEPHDDMYVNSDTKLCPGNYTIKDAANNGVIIMNNNGVKLDCNGATLNGEGMGTGIMFTAIKGATLQNCVVTGYNEGIHLSQNCEGNNVFHNMLRYNSVGMKVSTGGNNLIYENVVERNFYGVQLENSDNNEVNTNYVCGNGQADIMQSGTMTSHGTSNICDSPVNWNDTGKTRCTYICRLFGDVYRDCKVNIRDIVGVAKAFGKKAGEPGYDPKKDLNNDGNIGIDDLVAVAKNFGKKC